MSDLVDFVEKQEADARASLAQRITYLMIATLTSLIPVYLYQNIFGLSVQTNAALFAVTVFFSSIILTYGYHNVGFRLKKKLLTARRELLKERDVKPPTAQTDRKKFYLDLVEQQENNCGKEALAFSVLYNNSLFLGLTLLLSFYVLSSQNDLVKYLLSVTTSSAIVSLSTVFGGSKKKRK